jgi:MurNAc alpha-1-phosphate uridylyltransferase
VLDRLADAGVTRAVVNVHWFAHRLEDHLAARGRGPEITISDERAELLETGGGLKKALPLLGDAPVFVANIDSVWTDRGDALAELAALWDPERMDAALLLARREGAIGFEGGGDFFLGDDAQLTFRGEAAEAPFAYMGVHICRPGYVAEGPDGPFSLSGLWRRSAAEGRLFGCVLDGDWMHVGAPGARDEAEARLAREAR